MRAVAAALLVPFAAGCFAIADVDRFEKREDFVAHLIGFEAFVGERVEVRVVNQSDITDFVVEGRAVLDPMVADRLFAMPLALPEGSYGVDVFVDLDRSGDYEPEEPLWRAALGPDRKLHLEAADTDIMAENMDPMTRAEGTDFVLSLTGMNVHTGDVQQLEVLVVDRTDARSVGYFFLPDINANDIEIVIPDVIEAGHDYQVDFYADANRNGRYDDPGLEGDHTWREEGAGTAGEVGLQIDFDHQAIFDDVAVSFPFYEP